MLLEIQKILGDRFDQLRAERKALNYPVYALDHGLDADVIKKLKVEASKELRRAAPQDQHWLAWIVLGAEAGYKYAGGEYWPALENVEKEWRSNEARNWLREKYRFFARYYGGPVPVGRWAEHFSIMSWPIANSVLPSYLQHLFAWHLFEQRFGLSEVLNKDATGIGSFLLKRYVGPQGRFLDFLQQTDLTTQIVLALKDQEEKSQTRRLSDDLLTRIVADLERNSDSRRYLRDARKVLFQLRAGISHRLSPSPASVPVVPSKGRVHANASLVARPVDQVVCLGVVLPEIRKALEVAGLNASVLATAKVRFIGDGERAQPAIALESYSKVDRRLLAFPTAGAPVADPAGIDIEISRIILPLLCLKEEPVWVLRRYADGLFRQTSGRNIVASTAFILLSRQPLEADAVDGAGLRPCAVKVPSVCAYYLETDRKISIKQRNALERIGVGISGEIFIEPAGLAPKLDIRGEVAEWHTTETVMIRATSDQEISGYYVSLNQDPEQLILAPDGEIVLALDDVQFGRHRLSFRAAKLILDQHCPFGQPARFDFKVTAPRPWAEAMQGKSGFRLFAKPHPAQLEDIAASRSALCLVGPVGRTVTWSLETYDASGRLVHSHECGRDKIERATFDAKGVVEKILRNNSEEVFSATKINVVAGIGELGKQSVSFAHAVEPARWFVDQKRKRVRLIDETDHNEEIEVCLFNVAEPMKREAIKGSTAMEGIGIASPGALIAATYKSRMQSVFFSVPPDRISELTGLELRQDLQLESGSLEAYLSWSMALKLWKVARPVGNLSFVRLQMTVDNLEQALPALACGIEFASALKEADPTLTRARKQVGGSSQFAFLMTDRPKCEDEAAEIRFITHFAQKYGVEKEDKRCMEAFYLAFDQSRLTFGSPVEERERMGMLLKNRPLVRGAFLRRAFLKRAAATWRSAVV